ncbi:hypothetical protein P4O66_020061 [Electrophorus voltai]|uniref:Uncharacterized protein n=1 Tax=Electrophorus voltai TaxID=2609070 RepID=A0AAD8ZSP1_9TELE|nr:hypothetical protein P4O66_020061 [Electrophorus voltai]
MQSDWLRKEYTIKAEMPPSTLTTLGRSSRITGKWVQPPREASPASPPSIHPSRYRFTAMKPGKPNYVTRSTALCTRPALPEQGKSEKQHPSTDLPAEQGQKLGRNQVSEPTGAGSVSVKMFINVVKQKMQKDKILPEQYQGHYVQDAEQKVEEDVEEDVDEAVQYSSVTFSSLRELRKVKEEKGETEEEKRREGKKEEPQYSDVASFGWE